jgi:hypothetical protein
MVYGPAILAGIGTLPETLQQRSLVINLKRAKPGEITSKFDPRSVACENELRRKLARWAIDNLSAVRAAKPSLPVNMCNRQADVWRPLFTISHLAGYSWPERAAMAHGNLTRWDSNTEGRLMVMLADIREVFAEAKADKLTSSALVAALIDMEGHPWAEYQGRSPLTTHQLARLLRGFEIGPRTIRLGAVTAKGYELESFADAFARYLPANP